MLEPIDFTDNLLFTTVRIQTDLGVGTGFYFEYPAIEAGQMVPVLITNKHVVANASKGQIYFHLSENKENLKPSGKFYQMTFLNFAQSWIPHPDPNIDLCAIFILPIHTQIENETNQKVFFRTLSAAIIHSDEGLKNLTALEEVVMIGYPTGLWDEENNLPLIRKGITASHPGVNFRKKPIGVVDMACFPGSSGSPVFILNRGSYIDKIQNTIHMQNRMILLGILFEGPVLTAEGEIKIKDIPTQQKPYSSTQIMIHLGYYIKASELHVLGKALSKIHPKLKAHSNAA